MSGLALKLQNPRDRLGLKGPGATDWLAANGITPPVKPNTWAHVDATSADDSLLVARLGTAEFFLEDGPGGTSLKRMAPSLDEHLPGVYPVMREDWAFHLAGEGVHDVLAQVCNVNFAALAPGSQTVIMTLMIGVAVLVVAQDGGGDPTERHYRIWCDPTFGPYLGASLGAVVVESGGRYTGDCG